MSATTRRPRPGEENGREYLFMTEQEFAAGVARGDFLEWAEYRENRYGTPRPPVQQALAAGRPVLLEIDVQGARQVKAAMPEAVTVFVDPPSWQVLERRLRGRGTEDEPAVQRRLAAAKEELDAAGEFDHRIVNDNLADAVAEVDRILVGLPGHQAKRSASHQEGTTSP